jgi:hypothetical protein
MKSFIRNTVVWFFITFILLNQYYLYTKINEVIEIDKKLIELINETR